MAASLKLLVKSLGIKGARVGKDDDLALDAEAFGKHAAAIFAQCPLRVVRLWKATGDDLALALARPEFSGVQELFLFRNRLADEDLDLLFGCPHLTSLRALDFKWCGLNARHAAIIAAASPLRLPALRALSLFGNRVGAKGVQALAHSALLAQLTELDLEANHAGDPALAELLASPFIANLEKLAINRNEAGPLALAALENNRQARRLTELDIWPQAKPILQRNQRAATPYTKPKTAPAPAPAARPVKAKPGASDQAQGRHLLSQLLADPANASNRAVWSDWLLQHDDPRGEHLALEAAAAASKNAEIDQRLVRARAATLKALQQKYKNKAARYEFDSGLVTGVTCQLSWFLERGAELLTTEPLRRLVLEVASADGLPKLAQLAGIERLEWLVLTKPSTALFARIPFRALPKVSIGLHGLGFFRYEPLASYLALPNVDRLKELSFHTSSLDELTSLAAHSALRQLERLELDRSIDVEKAVAVLEGSKWSLRFLWLSRLSGPLRRRLEKRFAGVQLESAEG